MQVLANGGIAAVGALAVAAGAALGWPLMLGSLAASQADTWATEIGQTAAAPPRLITTGRPVPRGTSGAVSWKGTLGGAAGALSMSAVGLAVGLAAGPILAGGIGGLVGMTADSVLGATVQARYRCGACHAEVETARHCRTATQLTRGRRWLTNDMVNVIGSSLGGLIGMAASLV